MAETSAPKPKTTRKSRAKSSRVAKESGISKSDLAVVFEKAQAGLLASLMNSGVLSLPALSGYGHSANSQGPNPASVPGLITPVGQSSAAGPSHYGASLPILPGPGAPVSFAQGQLHPQYQQPIWTSFPPGQAPPGGQQNSQLFQHQVPHPVQQQHQLFQSHSFGPPKQVAYPQVGQVQPSAGLFNAAGAEAANGFGANSNGGAPSSTPGGIVI